MILSSLASIADRRASTPAAPFVAEEDGAARWGMAGAAAAARGMTGGGDVAFGSGFFHDGAAAANLGVNLPYPAAALEQTNSQASIVRSQRFGSFVPWRSVAHTSPKDGTFTNPANPKHLQASMASGPDPDLDDEVGVAARRFDRHLTKEKLKSLATKAARGGGSGGGGYGGHSDDEDDGGAEPLVAPAAMSGGDEGGEEE